MQAAMRAMQAAKTPAPTNGGSNRSQENEKKTIAAFKRAGFGLVTPNVDVFTFRRWVDRGFRPVAGSKSVKVSNLRLFCRAQVRELTPEEKATAASPQPTKAAAKRSGKVMTINSEAELPF